MLRTFSREREGPYDQLYAPFKGIPRNRNGNSEAA